MTTEAEAREAERLAVAITLIADAHQAALAAAAHTVELRTDDLTALMRTFATLYRYRAAAKAGGSNAE